jgi:hypothetical protein
MRLAVAGLIALLALAAPAQAEVFTNEAKPEDLGAFARQGGSDPP